MNMDAIIEIYFFQFQTSEWLWMYKLIITKFNQSNPIR